MKIRALKEKIYVLKEIIARCESNVYVLEVAAACHPDDMEIWESLSREWYCLQETKQRLAGRVEELLRRNSAK